MKKVFLILALILTLSVACFAFTACGEDTQSNPGDNSADSGTKPEPQPEPKPEPEKDEISFKTLEVNGTDVYGRVSKDKEIFEFTNEIKVSGNAKYVVALDALGMQPLATKTVSLNEGDNTFYVIEMVDDEATAVYTVVIHRIEVYEVSFVDEDVIAAETQYIEEGFFATAPTANVTTRLGYELLGWDFDFTKPITGDVVVKAKIEMKDEMKNFYFTSTSTTCEITGIKDKTLTHIVIPDYVTSIVDYAFYKCTGLTSVVIPNSVTSIGEWAFAYCSSLTSVVIPDSVTYIGGYAFYDCTSLTSVTIGNGVTSIGYEAFYKCTSLTSVTIGNSVTRIGDWAFAYCDGLKSMVIPDSVTNIGQGAFAYCTGLKSVVIPDSVTSIGGEAFDDCTSLTSVTIGNSVTSIGNYAFEYCYSLTSVTIGNSVTSIGKLAFFECTSLTSVTIPDSVTNIGQGAFAYCTRLTIYCEAASKPSGWDSYWNDSNRPVVWGHNNITSNSEYDYVVHNGKVGLTKYKGNATEITIPSMIDGYEVIRFGAIFSGNTNIRSITIPDSFTSIGKYAFYNCRSLTSVTIGNSVTSIGEYAFYKCTSLTSVTIGNGVTSIGEYAFYSCDSLTSVTIGNSVTSIGSSAFSSCDSLTSVTIPDSVTSIGSSVFSGCSSLESITIPFVGGSKSATSASYSTLFGYIFGTSSYTGGVATKQWCSSDYYDTYYIPSSLKSVTVTGGTIRYGAFYNCSRLTSVTIGNSVTSIGDEAFSGCDSLIIYCEAASKPRGWDSKWNYTNRPVVWGHNNITSNSEYDYVVHNGKAVLTKYKGNATEIIIPSTIDGYAVVSFGEIFKNNTSITSVVIPNSFTSIGYYAFEGCTGLTSVTIPDSVTSIGSSAFRGCTSLTSITIPDSVTSIGSYAFRGCTSLTSVTIPDSITSIGDWAFENCTGLTSVIIPNSVTRIGNYAFRYCDSLTIYCEAASKPSGWSIYWNDSGRPVVWGYKG